MRREPQASLTRLCSCGKFISDVWAKDRGCLVQRSVMFGPKISALCKEGEKGIVPKCTKTCSERFGECPLFSIHWAQGLNPLKRLPPSIDGHASIHRRGHLYPWARPSLSMGQAASIHGRARANGWSPWGHTPNDLSSQEQSRPQGLSPHSLAKEPPSCPPGIKLERAQTPNRASPNHPQVPAPPPIRGQPHPPQGPAPSSCAS